MSTVDNLRAGAVLCLGLLTLCACDMNPEKPVLDGKHTYEAPTEVSQQSGPDESLTESSESHEAEKIIPSEETVPNQDAE